MSAGNGHNVGKQFVDLFHGTDPESAEDIKEGGFRASYSDSAHFFDNPDMLTGENARPYNRGAVVHFRAPAHWVEEHYHSPAGMNDYSKTFEPEHRVYGVAPADPEYEDDADEMPGWLPPETVHCINGSCTKRKKP